MFIKFYDFIVNVSNVNYFFVIRENDESQLTINFNGSIKNIALNGTHAEVETMVNRLADSLPYFTDLQKHRTPEEQQGDSFPF